MQAGKKKLVLDHLIVQKMDDEEKDVQSILTFGAQALFETDGASTRDIHCQSLSCQSLPCPLIGEPSVDSDQDIDKLIERTETEGDEQETTTGEGAAFSFAKIWSADKDALEELDTDDPAKEDQDNAWTQTLQRIAEERAKAELVEETGRGTRRKAAPVFPKARETVCVRLLNHNVYTLSNMFMTMRLLRRIRKGKRRQRPLSRWMKKLMPCPKLNLSEAYHSLRWVKTSGLILLR
jgi:hypothetical protein